MIFFPLSIVAGAVVARRRSLSLALAAGTALFAVAVVVAWQVQGFAPSPRDLLWLALTWASAGIGHWTSPRRRQAPGAA